MQTLLIRIKLSNRNPLNSWLGLNLEAQHLKNQMLDDEIN